MARTAGDSWLEKGANLLLFGPPGARRKSESRELRRLAPLEHYVVTDNPVLAMPYVTGAFK